MLKVEPYNSNINFKASKKRKEKTLGTKQVIAYSVGGLALITGVTYGLIRHSNKIAAKKILEVQRKQIANDIDYRKQILKLANIEKTDVNNLSSIVSPNEYKNIIREFSNSPIHYTPGKTLITDFKDNYALEGVEARTFRATMHMHTINSDGKLTVKELLDKSAKYADEVYDAIKDKPNVKMKEAPFTIAITDHDTLEGCKEAVQIIAQNPEKYKNLRVVLGVEMSVESRMLGQEQNRPISIHMTTHCLNPFDADLNKFFNEKKQCRTNLMKDLIKKVSNTIPEYSSYFTFEESENLYPALKNKITHVNYSMKDYFQYKIIFKECFENNSNLQNKLKKAGIKTSEINYNSFLDKYANKEKNYSSEYYLKYYDALKNYISDLLKITPNETENMLVLDETTKQHLKKVEYICMRNCLKWIYNQLLLIWKKR